MDWLNWHKSYDSLPALQARLVLIRKHLARCLEGLPPGPVSMVSICAGDGRDIVGLLKSHPRAGDVSALLIEQDERLVAAGLASLANTGLEKRVQFAHADATLTNVYADVAPAPVVILSGVFGNVRTTDTGSLVTNLRSICGTGGKVVWTRHRLLNEGSRHIELIRRLFGENRFTEISLEFTPDEVFAVGTQRHDGPTMPLPAGAKLFEFTGFDRMRDDRATAASD